MEKVGFVVALTGVISVLCGIYAARNAYKSYALVLAGTYLFQTLAIAMVISSMFGLEVGKWHFIIPIILAVVVWLMARLSFLWLWGSLTFVGLIILAGLGGTLADDITEVVNIKTIGVVYLVGLIAAFVLRKNARVLTVAVTTGYNVGAGLLLVLMALVSFDEVETYSIVSTLFILAGVAAGIYYQYKVDRRLLDGDATTAVVEAPSVA